MKLRIPIAAMLLIALSAGIGGAWWYWTSREKNDSPSHVEHVAENDGSAPPPAPEAVDNPSHEQREQPKADPQWGNFSGKIVYDGMAPVPKEIPVVADQGYCGQHPLVDESLLVDPMSKGVKNVVVYLYPKQGDKLPKTHPAYEAAAEDKIVVYTKNCRFDPHVTLLRTTQTLVIRNSDPIGHIARTDVRDWPFRSVIPEGPDQEGKIEHALRLPCAITCNIHPWMKAWLLVQDHPYMAVTDEQGHFRIKNLPVGKWTFQFWHERTGYLRDVSIGGKPAKWPRGRVEIDVRPGENDLGKVGMKVEE